MGDPKATACERLEYARSRHVLAHQEWLKSLREGIDPPARARALQHLQRARAALRKLAPAEAPGRLVRVLPVDPEPFERIPPSGHLRKGPAKEARTAEAVERLVLAAVANLERMGRFVSNAPGADGYLPRLMVKERMNDGVPAPHLSRAMRRLLSAGRLERVVCGRNENRGRMYALRTAD